MANSTAFQSMDLRLRESVLRADAARFFPKTARNDGVGANSRIYSCNDEWAGKFATPFSKKREFTTPYFFKVRNGGIFHKIFHKFSPKCFQSYKNFVIKVEK